MREFIREHIYLFLAIYLFVVGFIYCLYLDGVL